MIEAGRTAASWLTGRVQLFLLALALLVAADIAKDDESFIRSKVDSMIPDAALADALEAKRNQALQEVDVLRRNLNAQLSTAHTLPADELARRLAQLDLEIK